MAQGTKTVVQRNLPSKLSRPGVNIRKQHYPFAGHWNTVHASRFHELLVSSFQFTQSSTVPQLPPSPEAYAYYGSPQDPAPISVLCFTASQILRPTMMWDFAADLVEILSEVETHRMAAVQKIQSLKGEVMYLEQTAWRKYLKNPHMAHQKFLSCIYYVRSMHLRQVCGDRSARPDSSVLLHHFPHLEQSRRPFDRYTSVLSEEEWAQYEKEAERMHDAFRKATEAANDDGLSDQLYARILEEAFGSDLIDWMFCVDGYLEQTKTLVEYAAKL